jgi:hypothetical protein
MDAAGLTILLAERLAAELPAWCAEFGSKVRAEQHWERDR